MTAALASAVAVLFASLVKGAIGFGFPTVSTPFLALFVDVKQAVVLLILPNLVMDVVQGLRRRGLVVTFRRFALLVAFGAVGTMIGTRLLILLSARTAMMVLGLSMLAFVALNATRWAPRVPPAWERWLDPVVGLGAGAIGGLTNVPGTPLVIYFYALGLAKDDFVRAVAVTFALYKLFQLGAVTWYGLMTWPLLGLSAALTVVALIGFRGGLAIQDRLEQRVFNRAILGYLTVLGAILVARSLW